MFKITDIYGYTYWINARHIKSLEPREVDGRTVYRSTVTEGITHYTQIRTIDGEYWNAQATVEQLLKLIPFYFGGEQ